MKIAITVASWLLIAWPAAIPAQEVGIEKSTQRVAAVEEVVVGSPSEQTQQSSSSKKESEKADEEDEDEDEPDCKR